MNEEIKTVEDIVNEENVVVDDQELLELMEDEGIEDPGEVTETSDSDSKAEAVAALVGVTILAGYGAYRLGKDYVVPGVVKGAKKVGGAVKAAWPFGKKKDKKNDGTDSEQEIIDVEYQEKGTVDDYEFPDDDKK